MPRDPNSLAIFAAGVGVINVTKRRPRRTMCEKFLWPRQAVKFVAPCSLIIGHPRVSSDGISREASRRRRENRAIIERKVVALDADYNQRGVSLLEVE
jgi:hypothetical protein